MRGWDGEGFSGGNGLGGTSVRAGLKEREPESEDRNLDEGAGVGIQGLCLAEYKVEWDIDGSWGVMRLPLGRY